jgi:hypothetical protein
MPVNALRENPNCKSTYASFRLIGDLLNPIEVSDRLRLIPSIAHAKGDPFRSHTRTGSRPIGVWSLSSKDRISSTNLEKHLTYLIDQFMPLNETLHDICKEQLLQADFFCYWLSATGHGGPEFSPEILGKISQLRAHLSIDFYCSSNE